MTNNINNKEFIDYYGFNYSGDPIPPQEKEVGIVDKIVNWVKSIFSPAPQIIEDSQFYTMTFDGTTWKLPRDLSILQITQQEMEQTNLVTAAIIRSRTNPAIIVDFEKIRKNTSKYTIFTNGQVTSTVCLPFNLQYHRTSCSVILCSRKQVGKGGQRNVRLCMDMMTQLYYVRKKTNPYELALVYPLEGQQHRGLVPIHNILTVFTSNGCEKTKLLEACYDQTLAQLLRTSNLNTTQKLALIGDLLSGLKTLHAIDHHIQLESCAISYKMFHNDIAPKNVVVKKMGDKWEAAFTDFGGAGILTEYGCASGYRSPDLLELIRAGVRGAQLVDYHLEFGTAKDIWALGVMFALILAQTPLIQFSEPVCSLPCIANLLNENQPIKDLAVADLTEAQIDQDLQNLREVAPDPSLIPIWDMVGWMLYIDPRDRITAQAAFEYFSSLKLS